MDPNKLEEITGALREKFNEHILGVEQHYDFPIVLITKDVIVPALKFLYEDERFQFRYLTTMCGLHLPNQEKPFGMMYQVHSLTKNLRLRFKSFTTEGHMEYETLTTLFPAANWMEREAFDFFGFRFKGHPNLKRILNVEDMDYYPLRKEYPIEDATRYDKDDTLFGREARGFDRKRLMS